MGIQGIDYFDQEVVSECLFLRGNNFTKYLTKPFDFKFDTPTIYPSKNHPQILADISFIKQIKRLNWFSMIPLSMPVPDIYPFILPFNDKMSELSMAVQLSSSKSFRNILSKYRDLLHRAKTKDVEDLDLTEQLLSDLESVFL